MQKIIYLVRGIESESYKDFSGRILKTATEFKADPGLQKIRAVFTAEVPPPISIIPFRKKKVATISLFSEDLIPVKEELMTMEGFSFHSTH